MLLAPQLRSRVALPSPPRHDPCNSPSPPLSPRQDPARGFFSVPFNKTVRPFIVDHVSPFHNPRFFHDSPRDLHSREGNDLAISRSFRAKGIFYEVDRAPSRSVKIQGNPRNLVKLLLLENCFAFDPPPLFFFFENSPSSRNRFRDFYNPVIPSRVGEMARPPPVLGKVNCERKGNWFSVSV